MYLSNKHIYIISLEEEREKQHGIGIIISIICILLFSFFFVGEKKKLSIAQCPSTGNYRKYLCLVQTKRKKNSIYLHTVHVFILTTFFRGFVSLFMHQKFSVFLNRKEKEKHRNQFICSINYIFYLCIVLIYKLSLYVHCSLTTTPTKRNIYTRSHRRHYIYCTNRTPKFIFV